MLWLDLVYVRSHVQASNRARWKADVPWTAFYSVNLVVMSVLAGLFKCSYNVLTASFVVDASSAAVEQNHGRVIFIVALVSSMMLAYLHYHVRRKHVLAKYTVSDVNFNFFDLVSRFVVPLVAFFIYIVGDSWLWSFFLVVMLFLTNFYAGRVLRAGVGVQVGGGGSGASQK